jgi:hypothetical protein
VKPVPLAALCAAGIIVAVSIVEFANNAEPISFALFGWIFELLRDGAVVVTFWYAASRAVFQGRSR